MKPDVRLCAHLAALDPTELRIEPADILEWDGGPVTAIVRCSQCPQAGLLELIARDPGEGTRSFTLAGLEADAFSVYRRDVERGSCDPRRLAEETAALYSSAGPVERRVTLRA